MGYTRSDVDSLTVNNSSDIDLSDDFSSDSIPVMKHSFGSVQFSWEDIDAFNATVILQGSNDNENWNDLGGNTGGIILLNTPGSQVWEFTEFTTRYIRLSYQANSVSEGSATGLIVLKRET